MDKIQIISIEDLFTGKQPQLPGAAENKTFKKAKRNEGKRAVRGCLIEWVKTRYGKG
jgi:hypothetical protein